MSSLRSHLNIRRLAALALVLWLGGVVCLVVRPTSASAAMTAGPQVSHESGSCSMNAGHVRSHPQRSEDQRPYAGTPSRSNDSMSCCPLAGQSAATVSKARAADTLDMALTPDKAVLAPMSPASAGWTSGKTHVPDRGGTYLHCCVFLI
jgi:hypothetical protein